ncbi:MAG: hypothetical protein GY950_13660 [bacterium]|nr:hypothetical protein [bacterium]
MDEKEVRDRYAAAALNGLLNNKEILADIHSYASRTGMNDEEATAVFAFKYADAMMKKR